MRRLVVALALLVLVATAASGCSWFTRITSPQPLNSGGIYNGEPTKLVIRLGASGMVHSPFRWAVVRAAEVSQTAVIRIARFDERNQIWEKVQSIPYDPASGSALELTVPAYPNYEVSAIAHGSGLKAIGRLSSVGAAADTTNVVTLPMSKPTYLLMVPTVVYQGGSVQQFAAYSANQMATAAVLIGLNSWEGNGNVGSTNAPGGWMCVVEEGTPYCGDAKFPSIATDTYLYYQIRVCNKRVYGGGEFYCYYEPDLDIGEALRSVPFSAGEPPY